MHARTFVGTMLGPHDGEHAQLRQIRLTPENPDDLVVFLVREIVLRNKIFRHARRRRFMSSHVTVTSLLLQHHDLLPWRVHIHSLPSLARRLLLGKWAEVAESPYAHLLCQRLMTIKQRLELALPSQ